MLGNYGRILAEYPFLKEFRNNNLSNYIEIDGIDNLEQIKKSNKPVVFISGHFSNFELMAMQIEKMGIKIAAVYRPLNNVFLNKIMERIRKKYICKNQIKKGIGRHSVVALVIVCIPEPSLLRARRRCVQISITVNAAHLLP